MLTSALLESALAIGSDDTVLAIQQLVLHQPLLPLFYLHIYVLACLGCVAAFGIVLQVKGWNTGFCDISSGGGGTQRHAAQIYGHGRATRELPPLPHCVVPFTPWCASGFDLLSFVAVCLWQL